MSGAYIEIKTQDKSLTVKHHHLLVGLRPQAIGLFIMELWSNTASEYDAY